MPTISFFQNDFERLLGQSVLLEQLESWLPLVKGELKDFTPATGEIRLELQDSNRPDLWSVEGIARQIRIKLQGAPGAYPFLQTKGRPKRRILVAEGLDRVRPYVAACAAMGYSVTEDGLAQLIQAQEKLADLYGHKRKTVSVGLYRLARIQFPVTYGLVKPTDARFTPLGFSEKLTLQDILTVHPKGIEYGSILADQPLLPLLWDAEGHILSFPPIINSQDLGQVRAGDSDLLVEVTGTDLRMVLLTLNVFATNLADRGAAIDPIEIQYPYDTDWGKSIKTPCDVGAIQKIPLDAIETALGLPIDVELVQQTLRGYGYDVKASRKTLAVRLPHYRSDFMHPVDVAEDVAISRGYDSFVPEMPAQFTVGSLSPLEQTSDSIRDHMIGQGFQEIFSNILLSHEELVERMRLPTEDQERDAFSRSRPPIKNVEGRHSRARGNPDLTSSDQDQDVPSTPLDGEASQPPHSSPLEGGASQPLHSSPLEGEARWGVVEVDNVMSHSFSCLRSWMLPSLLRVEAASPRAFYPHRLFEIGEVAIPDSSQELGSRTAIRLGTVIAHPTANFSEVHTCLDVLMFYLVKDYELEPVSHASFLDGRAGSILCQGQARGLIGELHPEVLENWGISVPISVVELDVDWLCSDGP